MNNNIKPIVAYPEILGHGNSVTTEIYLQGIGDFERQAIAEYEKARQKYYKTSHTDVKRNSAGNLNSYFWRARQDSNLRPTDSKSGALSS